MSKHRDSSAAAPRPSRTLGWTQRIVGFGLILLAVIAFNEARHGRIDGAGATIVVAIGAVAGGLAGARVFVKGKRRTARTAEEVLAADARPPVLYLRAFRDDEIGAARYTGTSYPFPMLLNTEEEQLAKVFDPIGPVIGLGRPGSDMPELGAAREWVSDEQWQQTVLDRMDRARLVMVRLAETESVWWELARSHERLSPERLVLLVPFGRDDYDRIRPRVEEALQLRLPDYVEGEGTASIQGIVMFDDQGRGRYLPVQGSWFRTSALNPIASELRNSVEPIFDQLGVEWDRPGPAPLRLWFALLAVVMVVGLIVSVILLALGIG